VTAPGKQTEAERRIEYFNKLSRARDMSKTQSHHKDGWYLSWSDKWRKPKKVDLYGFGKPEHRFVDENIMNLRRK